MVALTENLLSKPVALYNNYCLMSHDLNCSVPRAIPLDSDHQMTSIRSWSQNETKARISGIVVSAPPPASDLHTAPFYPLLCHIMSYYVIICQFLRNVFLGISMSIINFVVYCETTGKTSLE